MSTLVTYKIRSSNFINCFKSNNISERSHPPFQENISGKSGENNRKKRKKKAYNFKMNKIINKLRV